jgi:uncharacterized damage-inducible protein DinB
MQVTDLVGYNHVVRGLYLDALAKLPWTQVVEHKGLSFDSMRGVFLHLTLVEDRWISYTIPGRFSDWVDPDFESFRDMASLKGYRQEVEGRTMRYIEGLSLQELNREIAVPWSGNPTRITVEKALTHMVLEDMIHYGELSAVLWQMGLEAPYSGFWRYGISEPVNASFEPLPPRRH